MLLDYEIHGTEGHPQLVLIHGITESLHAWDPLLDDLSTDLHLLTVDLRGHGSSDVVGPYDPMSYAGDVIETMEATGFAGAAVVGHSLGGIVASAVAAAGGAGRVLNIDQPMQLSGFKALLSGIEPLLRGDEATFLATIDSVFDAMAAPLPAAEVARIGALRNARQEVVVGTWAIVLESTEAELDATVESLASTISVPYLALHGSDPGPGYEAWLTGLVPTATLEVWADHGHYPHLIDPERFAARLRRFLTE